MPNTVSLAYATKLVDQMRQIFRKCPQVTTVVSQLGRPDDGTDPTSYFNAEFFVNLTPRDEWPRGLTKESLVHDMEKELKHLERDMLDAAKNLEFEKAAQLRDRLAELKEAMFGVALPGDG